MFCSLPKPSRQGFAFPPSASPREPGSPPELARGIRSHASQSGWRKAAGVTGLGSPFRPFPVSLSLASEHKPCRSICFPAQHIPASPNKPHIKPGSLKASGNWPLEAFPFPDPWSRGGRIPVPAPQQCPVPGISRHWALTIWKSLPLHSSLPKVQRTSISPRSS